MHLLAARKIKFIANQEVNITMSKNHPNDNIYSILSKLDALKPTPQETHAATVKQIYESVEAQGSILSGVSKVEAKLRTAFNETADNKYAVGMAAAKKQAGYSKAPAHDLPKKVVKKGHEIAKEIDEGEAFVSDDVWRLAKQLSKLHGVRVEDFGPAEVDAIADHVGLGSSDVAEILELTQGTDECMAEGTGVTDYNPKSQGGTRKELLAKYHKTKDPKDAEAARKAGATQKELQGLNEAEQGMAEDPMGEIEGGSVAESGVTTRVHKGTYGTSYNGDDAPKEKQGRGRPKNPGNDGPGFDTSALNNVFGTKAPATGVKGTKVLGKAMSHPSNNIKDELDETMRSVGRRILEGVNFKRHMEETQMTLDEMLGCLGEDLRTYKESGVMTDLLRDCMDVHAFTKRQMADEAITSPSPTDIKMATPAYQRKASGAPDWNITQADFDQKERETPTTHVGLSQRAKDLGIAEELNELARLAGLPVKETEIEQEGAGVMHFKAEKAKEQGKDSFKLGDKEFPVDEETEMEGNAFSGAVADAKAHHKDTFKVGGKEYHVKEADAPVEEPVEEPVNGPKKQYMSMKASTMAPGEGDAGEKRMNPDRATYKNGDNAMSKPPVRETATLEARLAAEYESIKKVSETQVNELSKDTLGKYVNKSATSLGNAAHGLGDKRAQSAEIDRFTNRHMPDKFDTQDKMKDQLGVGRKSQNKDTHIIQKRTHGIGQAVKRLSK